MIEIIANNKIKKINDKVQQLNSYQEEKKLLDEYLQEINYYSDKEKNDSEKVSNLIVVLEAFEELLNQEEKLQKNKSDYEYLVDIANELNAQVVRKNDNETVKQGLLFMIYTTNKKEKFFITRNKLMEYIKQNKLGNTDVYIIDEPEIDEFLSIIKRFFGKRNFTNTTFAEAIKRNIADYNYLKDFANTINEQEIRDADYKNVKNGAVFKLISKDKTEDRFFITRKQLNNYIKEKKKKVDEYTIEVINNSDLDKIINIIIDNFE